MSESQTFIATFNTVQAYEKYKQEVIDGGGKIKDDLGSTIRGFTAVFPSGLAQSILSCNLVDNGISSFEPDSVATINTH